MPDPVATQPDNRQPIRDPRDAAYRHLSRHAKRFPDLIPTEVNVGPLDQRDSALAHAIVDASLTRWITLGYIITTLSHRSLLEHEPRMQAVLLGGAAQLLLLDRVPPHAVLDESVEWAKRNIRPCAGGMVNAILRKVARAKGGRRDAWDHHIDSIPLSDGRALALRGVELPDDGRRRLGIACSLPVDLLQRWEKVHQDPTAAAMHTLCKAPTLICTRYAEAPLETDELAPHQSPHHAVYTGNRQSLIALLESRPDIWVQDPASSTTLGRLSLEKSPDLIVDLCAGQGTKTRQLRAMYPDAELVAAEVDEKRLGVLRGFFAGDERVRVMHADKVAERFNEAADLVLADVPCSNTGVLARRREARYRPLNTQLGRLLTTQREILTTTHALTKPGGHVLYATCSLEAEENEHQAQWAAGHLGMELLDSHGVVPQVQPGDSPDTYRDGSFSALLRRPPTA
ncbi:MAG: transcription antitermination factor NusB [Phycisphaerales bacterium]